MVKKVTERSNATWFECHKEGHNSFQWKQVKKNQQDGEEDRLWLGGIWTLRIHAYGGGGCNIVTKDNNAKWISQENIPKYTKLDLSK